MDLKRKATKENKIKQKIKKRLSRYLWSFAFLVLFSIITFLVVFSAYDYNEIMSVIYKVDYRYLFLGVLMVIIYMGAEALSLKNLFKAQDFKVRYRSTFKYALSNYYFSSITPAAFGGQTAVSIYMNKDHIPPYKATITVLLNAILFRLSLIIIVIAALIVRPEFFIKDALLFSFLLVGFIFNLIMVVLFGFGLFSKKTIRAILRFGLRTLIKLKVLKRKKEVYLRLIDQKIHKYNDAAKYVTSNKKEIFLSLILSIIQRAAIFSVGYFIFLGFLKQEMNPEEYDLFKMFWDFIFIHAIVSLAVESLPIPGGIIISERFMLSLYTFVYTMQMRRYLAAALLITRSVVLYMSVLVTGIIFFIIFMYRMLTKRRNYYDWDL